PREPPQELQIGAPVLRLAGGSRLFVRAADRPVVAVPAGAAVGHGGQKALGERATDDLDDLARNPTPLGVERHDALLVAAVGGAVVEPSSLARIQQDTIDGEWIHQ